MKLIQLILVINTYLKYNKRFNTICGIYSKVRSQCINQDYQAGL